MTCAQAHWKDKAFRSKKAGGSSEKMLSLLGCSEVWLQECRDYLLQVERKLVIKGDFRRAIAVKRFREEWFS